MLHPIQVAKGRLKRGEEFDGDVTSGLPALRRRDLLPQFAGEWLAVFLDESSRQINKITGSHKWHKRWKVAIDHRRGAFRQIDLQGFQPFINSCHCIVLSCFSSASPTLH